MADKDGKLFDISALTETAGEAPSADTAIDPKLIARTPIEEDREERLEVLRYKEKYRQRVRRAGTRIEDTTEERLAAVREAQRSEAGAAMEFERNEAKAHTDRISELLSRIDAMRGADTPKVIDMALGSEASVIADEPLKGTDTPEPANSTDTPASCESADSSDRPPHSSEMQTFVDESYDGDDGVITVKSNIKSEILHIDATKYNLGTAPAENSGAQADFVPLKRQSGTAEKVKMRPSAPSTEARGGLREHSGVYTTGAVAYSDPEVRLYSDPEHSAYPEAERRLYSDPERSTYPEAERRLYSDPERSAYPEAERRLYSDPERSAYPEAERRLYSDPERSTYPDPEVGTYSETSIDAVGSDAQYADSNERFIKRRPGRDNNGAYTYTESYPERAKTGVYPDPEAVESIDPEASLDPSYPDPVHEKADEKRPLTARELKKQKREEKRAAIEDALRFEREMTLGGFSGGAVPDPESNEYADAEAIEYPDPEAPSLEGGSLLDMIDDPNAMYEEAKNTADGLLASGTKPKAVKKFVKRAVALDVKRIKERYIHRLKELKLELRGKELRFSYKKEKEARSEREIRADIRELNIERNNEIHRSRVMGRVALSVLLTDFSTSRIKRRVNRAVLVELRSKLLHLITERYYFDENMIALYRGKVGRGDADGRYSAEIRGLKRAYKIQKRTEREVEENKVSPGYKKKIYPLMNEFVELSGELEKVVYSLKHEKPRGAVKRELKRKRRKLKRKLARVSDHIHYYKKRGIERAEDKREIRQNAILGWLVLGALVAAGVLVYMNWDAILAYLGSLIKGFIGG